MNKTFKNAIATLTLSAFVFGSGSVLLPANALAAAHNYNYGKHEQHHKRHESTKITKTGAAVLGTAIIGALIANAIHHHKAKKKANQEEASE